MDVQDDVLDIGEAETGLPCVIEDQRVALYCLNRINDDGAGGGPEKPPAVNGAPTKYGSNEIEGGTISMAVPRAAQFVATKSTFHQAYAEWPY